MPRKPILSRTLLYGKLRDGTYRLLDWNQVNTSLGAMVEPRMIRYVEDSKLVNLDVYDVNFTDIVPYNEDRMWAEMGTAGFQIPRDFTV